MTLNSLRSPMRTVADLEEYSARNYADTELLIVDLDRLSAESISTIDDLKKAKPGLRILGATGSPAKWKDSVARERAEWVNVMRKPLGVWAIHSVLQMIPDWKGHERIEDQVERIKVEGEQVDNKTEFVEKAVTGHKK